MSGKKRTRTVLDESPRKRARLASYESNIVDDEDLREPQMIRPGRRNRNVVIREMLAQSLQATRPSARSSATRAGSVGATSHSSGFSTLSGLHTKSHCQGRTAQKRSSMPRWMVESLSKLPVDHPLATTKPSRTYQSSSDESPLPSLHASTSSHELEGRATVTSLGSRRSGKYALSSVSSKPLPRSELQPPEEPSVFAFSPPPISPVRLKEPLQHLNYQTSTPPIRYFNPRSISAQDRPSRQKASAFLNPDSDKLPSTLFDSTIPAIVLARPHDRPPTPYSLHTTSPPSSVMSMLSENALQTHTRLDTAKPKLANLLLPTASMLHRPLSTPTEDPFGAAWTSLRRSTPPIPPHLKPATQRRFFFSSSRLANTVPSSLPADEPHTWTPSFPNARIPNHRNAPVPLRSQLRNGFLGSKDPLVTLEAIEEATLTAARNADSHDVVDAADVSNHVRFSTSRGSTVSMKSLFGPSSKQHDFTNVIAARDSGADLTNDMCFFYDQTDDRLRFEDIVLSEPISRAQTRVQPGMVYNDQASPSRMDAMQLAGLGTEDELLALFDTDAGDELMMEEHMNEPADQSVDSIHSWAEVDVA